ncbi:MAG: LA2681 family HEPN domain-containing protein [Clostridium chrysemydis]|uniref:LA2681 family HEPN domain-containing protein n=1 Tax=Clostridium chrysemydis TaxID=2665504 RepID=UPI003F400FFA
MKELWDLAYKYVDDGDIDNALKVLKVLKETDHFIEEGIQKDFILSALHIDIGGIFKREAIVEIGIELILKNLEFIENNIEYQQSSFYNLGNGYSALFNIKNEKNKFCSFFNRENDGFKALKYYNKALNSKVYDKNIKVQLLTNFANVLSVMGRDIEAIEYYNKSLDLNSKYGMTLINKGIAIKHYARLTGEKWGMYYNKAYDLIQKGLNYGVYNEARSIGLKCLAEIEESINVDPIKICGDYKEEFNSSLNLEKFSIMFCKKHKLFLNICEECQGCQNITNDNLTIRKMTVDINTEIDDDPFLKLSSFLNEIKQNYVAARFLIIQSQYKDDDLSFVDNRLSMVNTLNYIENNIYIQLLKFAYKNMFDILDKIAIFINEYLSLGKSEKHIDFNRIWASKNNKNKINELILKSNNINLNALFSLSVDLKNGELKYLNDIRNALTHRFLNIKLFKNEDLEELDEEELLSYTIQISQIVRSAIIYLLAFVDDVESIKSKNSKGVIEIPYFIQ